MWMFSVFCLGVTALLCVLGTLYHRFQDNLLQRCGMALLALSCVARGAEILVMHSVAIQALLMHLAIAMFAAGTGFKHWLRHYQAGKLQRRSA